MKNISRRLLACLLGAVGSAAGILVLTEGELYDKTVPQVREEVIRSRAEALARDTAMYYCSQNLGGCPEEMIESLDGWMEEDFAQNQFRPGAVGYLIRDPEGNVVEDCGLESYSRVVNFPFTDSYRELLSLRTQ